MENINNKVFSNLIWRFAERCGAQGVTFIVSIILARLLDPELYGTVALVTVFLTILEVFIDSGMGNALIQKKNADDLDYSSVFYFNFVSCLILYSGMFFAAPFIAKFYNIPTLTSIVRVISLTLVISGIKNIQQAYVSSHLLFKKFFYSTIGGTIFSAVIGIIMAYKGFGVWAIVFQQLSNTAIDTLILWITVKWRPKLIFSWGRLKKLLGYGWKLLLSSLIDTMYNNIRQLIIGKLYSKGELAYYNQGKKFPHLIITNVNTSIDSVLLPTMSKEQDRIEKIKTMTRKSIKMSTYIMAPFMMGMAFCATPLVKVVLTDKWLPCVPFLQIFCIVYMFYPIHTSNLNAIKAMGRSDLFLKLEVQKKIVGVILLLISMQISVMAMAYSLLISSVASQIINTWPNKKLLNYGYLEQLRDILPGITLALGMGICVYMINMIDLNPIIILVMQFILGAAIYIVGSVVFRIESFRYLLNILKRR